MNKKGKLTITIDTKVLVDAKTVARKKGIPISRAIENFLRFFSSPWVYCFKCGKRFYAKESKVCPKCGWLICPTCKACRCTLDENIATVAFYMRKVYEELLAGRVE